jgi:hypothetical protein
VVIEFVLQALGVLLGEFPSLQVLHDRLHVNGLTIAWRAEGSAATEFLTQGFKEPQLAGTKTQVPRCSV